MQAIVVKTLPVTNTKPHRVKATCAVGSVTVSVHEADMCDREPTLYAAEKLCCKFNWFDTVNLIGGTLPNGDIVYVMVSKE